MAISLVLLLLLSIKRDWPPCKVVFRVGNQNTYVTNNNKVMFLCVVTSSTGMYRASSVVLK